MGAWDTPPTADEMHAADPWGAPPTAAESTGVAAPSMPKPQPGWRDRAGTAIRQWFDPGYTPENPGGGGSMADVGRQALKGASFFAGPALGGAMYAAGEGGGPGDIAAGAAGGYAIGKALPRVLSFLGGKSESAALESAKKALTGNRGVISAQRPLSDEAARAALSSGAIRPMSNVGGIADRLGGSVDAVEGKLADVLGKLEAAGVKGPNPAVVSEMLRTRGNEVFDQTAMPRLRDIYNQTADALTEIGNRSGGPLRLTQAESIKRAQQSEANYANAQRDKLTNISRKQVARVFREANEKAVEDQASKAPDLAAQFVPLKRELGPLLEAQSAADVASARFSRNQTHGLGSMVMASGALAHGNVPEALALLYGTTAAKSRGPATMAWTYDKLGRVLSSVAPRSDLAAPAAGSETAALARAIRARLGQPALVPAAAEEEGAK